MSEALELTDEERALIERLRAQHRRPREASARVLWIREGRNAILLADPQAAARACEPGAPPIWHIDPDELAEIEAFENECACAGLGTMPATDGGQ
jgi:hypothetical protein